MSFLRILQRAASVDINFIHSTRIAAAVCCLLDVGVAVVVVGSRSDV